MPDAPLILVVDDEEAVARAVGLMLTRAGYRVLVSTSAEQALESWTPEVRILLTDCIMPGVLGEDLACLMLERAPSLKVLFMSGNHTTSVAGKFVHQEGVNFIQKPFAREQLLKLVNQISAGL